MNRLTARAAKSRFAHLPAGRDPGLQTLRNRQRRGFLTPLLWIVGAGMFAAGIWVAAGGRGARFDRQEELWGGLFFAACGVLVLYVPVVAWARDRPRRDPRLRELKLSVAGDGLRRGDRLSVAVAGRPPEVARLQVGVACDERFDTEVHTNVMVTRETGQATVYEDWQVAPPGPVEHTVTFELPVDAPYSYEGDCVSYAWRVSARAVRAGLEDPRLDEPIWVEP